MTYLLYIKQNHENDFCKSILNSSIEFLPHKLELLKSDKAKIRLEIKQVFNDGIDDYINLHRTTFKLKNEINKIRDESSNLSSRIQSALDKVKGLKQEKNKIEAVNKKIDIYKSLNLNQNELLNIFDLPNLLRLCVKMEQHQEAYNLFIWFKKFTQAKNEKHSKVKDYFKNQHEQLKHNIFEYFLHNVKKQKFNKLLPLLRLLLQEGEFDLEEVIPKLFMLFYGVKLKKAYEKLSIHKPGNDMIPKLMTLFAKSCEKAFILVIKLMNDVKNQINPTKFMHYVIKHNLRLSKYFKYIIKHSDEDFFFQVGYETLIYEPKIDIDFMVFFKEITDGIHDKNFDDILNKFKIYLRYIDFHNSFVWMRSLNIKEFEFKEVKPEMTIEEKRKILESNLHKLMGIKKGNEITILLYNNVNSLFWYEQAFSKEVRYDYLGAQSLLLAHNFKREAKLFVIDFCDHSYSESLCEIIDFLIDNLMKYLIALLSL